MLTALFVLEVTSTSATCNKVSISKAKLSDNSLLFKLSSSKSPIIPFNLVSHSSSHKDHTPKDNPRGRKRNKKNPTSTQQEQDQNGWESCEQPSREKGLDTSHIYFIFWVYPPFQRRHLTRFPQRLLTQKNKRKVVFLGVVFFLASCRG